MRILGVLVAACFAGGCQLVLSFDFESEHGAQCYDGVDNDRNGVQDGDDPACNEDRPPDVVPGSCGDGRVDTNEQCDFGPENGGDTPGACGHDCRFVTCGGDFPCTEVDECASNLDNCSQDATCFNVPGPGSFMRSCNSGFMGDGVHCQDVDECAFGACGPEVECKNLPGSFECGPGGTPGQPSQKVVAGSADGLYCDTSFSNTGRKISVDDAGVIYVAMRCESLANPAGAFVHVVTSKDRGITYSPAEPIDMGQAVDVAIEGGPGGVAYLVAIDVEGVLRFTRTETAGDIWAPATVLGTGFVSQGISIGTLGPQMWISALRQDGTLRVYQGAHLGNDIVGLVDLVQPTAFFDLLVDELRGFVITASDTPEFHLRVSEDFGVSFGGEMNPPGGHTYSDWALARGTIYAVGSSGADASVTVISTDTLGESSEALGLPLVSTPQARSIAADRAGNAWVVSQLDSGEIQLNVLPFGATSISGGGVFGPGSWPGVTGLVPQSGAAVVYTLEGDVIVAVIPLP